MRGSRQSLVDIDCAAGIIPAHAGLTLKFIDFHVGGWDHPRACGAHQHTQRFLADGLGSSPRMRGSPGRDTQVRLGKGIIPAHAGLTILGFRDKWR